MFKPMFLKFFKNIIEKISSKVMIL